MMGKNAKTRVKYILDYINENEFADVTVLSKNLGVSEMTIRRDLAKLYEDNCLLRVYGGARSIPKEMYEAPLDKRILENKNEKVKIGEYAAQLINDGDIIALDASSTSYEMAKFIKNRVTIVTNNISIVSLFVDNDLVEVVLLGGKVRKSSLSTVGFEMVSMMKNFHVDKAFISSKAIDFEHGLSDATVNEGEAKKAMINASKQVYLMMDHTKIDKCAFYKVCDTSEINDIITDHTENQELYKEFYRKCENLNIRVHLA